MFTSQMRRLLGMGLVVAFTVGNVLAADKNMVKNSSFELGMANFAMNSWVVPDKGMNTPAVKPEFDATAKKHGNVSLKIDNSHGDIFRLISGELKLSPGKRYTMSAWMKSDKPGYSVRMVVESVAPGSKWNSHVKAFSLSERWNRYSFSFQVPANGVHTLFNARIESNINYKMLESNKFRFPGTIWLDALQLNEGALEGYVPYANTEAAVFLDKKFPLYDPREKVSGHIEVFQYAGQAAQRRVAYDIVNDYDGVDVSGTNVEIRTIPEKKLLVPFSMRIDKRGGYALRAEIMSPKTDGAQTSLAEVYAAPITYFAVSESAEVDKDAPVDAFSIGANMTIFPNSIWGRATREYVLRKIDGFDSPYKWYASQGIRWIRDWGGRSAFTWSDIEPERGKYNWTATDYVVDQAEKHHIRILPVLGGDSFQRRTTHRWQIQAFPKWVLARAETMPSMNPRNAAKGWRRVLPRIEDWKNYIKAVATRYKGSITHYEIMNEPNLSLEPKQYVKYLKAAYEAAKSVDPACKIVGMCATGDLGGQLIKFVEGCCKLGALKYCDVVSFHPYNARLIGSARSAPYMIHALRRLIDKYGGKDKPLWNTELFYLSNTVKSGFDASIYEGNAIARRFFIDLGEGVQQSMPLAYLANSRRTMFKNRHMGSTALCIPSARYVVYAQLARHFEGAKPVTRIRWPNRDVCYVIEKNGRTTAVVWNYDQTQYDSMKLALSSSQAEVRDMFWNSIRMKPDEISLRLGHDPYYIVWKGRDKEKFIKALKNVKIHGEKSLLMTGSRVGFDSLTFHLRNTTGEQIKGLLKVTSNPDWMAVGDKAIPYGPVKPYASCVVAIPATLKTTGARTGIVSLSISTKNTVLDFKSTVRRPLLLNCVKFMRSPSIDADPKDAEWKESDTMTIDQKSQVKMGASDKWKGPLDCSATLRSGYDAKNIYFLINVKDDRKGGRLSKMPWTGDAVELFLDFSDNPGAMYTNDTYQLFFAPPADGEKPKLSMKTKGKESFNINEVNWSCVRSEYGYIIELAIPFAALGVRMEDLKGKSIGFDIAVDDADDGLRETQMVWSGNELNYKDRSKFGRLIFEK